LETKQACWLVEFSFDFDDFRGLEFNKMQIFCHWEGHNLFAVLHFSESNLLIVGLQFAITVS